MAIVKNVVTFLVISVLIYLGISLVLTFWPTPEKKRIENFDYSSLLASAGHTNNSSEHKFSARNGQQLFFRLYESSSDATLILLHGSGAEGRYFSQLASYLANSGIMRVITPDLRGHGRNDGPRGDIDYIGQLDHDIEDLINYVSSNYAGTKVILGGHSSGGGMALRYAGNHDLVQPQALLLFAPYLGHDAPTVKPNSGEWVTVAVKRIIGLTMLNNLGITAFNDLAVLQFNRPEEWDDSLQVPSYSYRLTTNFGPTNYIDDVAKIDVPTLVLVGENDESFHPNQFNAAFNGAAPKANVHLIANAKHMDIVDNGDAIQLIASWYSELTSVASRTVSE